MQLSFAKKLSLCICKTDVGSHEDGGKRLETCKIFIASFPGDDKDRKSNFFEETFLLVGNSMHVTF